jgi:uncharacterized membrane protein YqjE
MSTGSSPAEPPFLDAAGRWLRELPALVGDRLELLALELEQAGRSALQVAVLAVAAALLAVTAWLALWALVAGLLAAAGLHWGWALTIVVVANAAAAALAAWRAARLLPALGLPATRRHLRFSADPGAPEPPEQPHVRAAPPMRAPSAAPSPTAALTAALTAAPTATPTAAPAAVGPASAGGAR